MKVRTKPRAPIVVDTGPLIALGDESDEYHDVCVAWYRTERAKLLVPIPVITEVGYTLGKIGGPALEAAFLRGLGEDRRLLLQAPGRQDLCRMAEIMLQYEGLNLGTADVAVMAIAERCGTTTIATVDHRDFSAITPANGTHFELVPVLARTKKRP